MKKVIYPGTFDPITNGHIDIIKRASCIFDEVIVSVAQTPSKDALFSCQERLAITKEAVKNIENVNVLSFRGLVVDFAQQLKVRVIIRGLRMLSDFEYEFQMALTNRSLSSEVETIFLMPHPQYSYLSSRLVKETAELGADLKQFLPANVVRALKKKTAQKSG